MSASREGFFYQGKVPPSKSLLNRALIVASYMPLKDFEVFAQSCSSQAQDVLDMELALTAFLQGEKELWCGEAGTVLRFLAFRVSRVPGRYVLKGHASLFKRPQDTLKDILAQLGVQVSLGADCCILESQGWQVKGPVTVDQSVSSQFASGLLMNGWELPNMLELRFSQKRLSEAYFAMTRTVLEKVGMKILPTPVGFELVAGQRLFFQDLSFLQESDMSSAFAVAALAAVSGQAEFLALHPKNSLQPDRAFAEILQKMGVEVVQEEAALRVSQSGKLKSIDVSLSDTPDLFPVLAVLCSLAEGTSYLRGAPHLVHKESNRVERIRELLVKMRRKLVVQGEDICIEGQGKITAGEQLTAFEYDATGDHRLVMAAATALYAGAPVQINGVHALKKSFPEFLDIAQKISLKNMLV